MIMIMKKCRGAGRGGGGQDAFPHVSHSYARCPVWVRRCAVRSPLDANARSHLSHLSRAKRDETCPISTEGWTRRVQLVQEGGGGGGRAARSARLLPPPLPSSWDGGKWPQTLTLPRRALCLQEGL